MNEKPVRQFLYRFEVKRPELIADLDAWTEEENRIAGLYVTEPDG